ncbi:MAG: PilZ domain-containing protein [Candidatus Omnitrophota bacterium]
MVERRRYVRWKLNLPVACKLLDSPTTINTVTNDIGLRGLQVTLPWYPEVNSLLEVKIETEKTEEPILVKGEIVWQGRSQKEDNFNTGIYFTKIKSQDKERLFKYILEKI